SKRRSSTIAVNDSCSPAPVTETECRDPGIRCRVAKLAEPPHHDAQPADLGGNAIMRNYPVALSAVSLMLSGCSAEVGLSPDLVERAATCAVVSASEARSTAK